MFAFVSCDMFSKSSVCISYISYISYFWEVGGLYKGCSKSSWPDHEVEETQGSLNV